MQGERKTMKGAPFTTTAGAAATQMQGLAQMQLSTRLPVLTSSCFDGVLFFESVVHVRLAGELHADQL